MVVEELAESSSLIEAAANGRRYWIGPRQLPTATWNEYRTDIATAIESPLDWRHVTTAFDAVNDLNWAVEHRRNTDQSIDTPIRGAHVHAQDNTREVWRMIRQAIESLGAIIGVEGDSSRLALGDHDRERKCWPYGDGDDFDEEAASNAAEAAYWEKEG